MWHTTAKEETNPPVIGPFQSQKLTGSDVAVDTTTVHPALFTWINASAQKGYSIYVITIAIFVIALKI